MSIRINSLDKIKRRLNIQDNGPAHAYFTELCYKKMDEFVPMSGNKSETSLRTTVVLTTDSITYASSYASYQYFGQRKDGSHKVNPKNYTTPGTGKHWDKKMKTAYMKDIVKEVKNFVKLHGGE